MRIIVITGWSQSGKDTVADILVKECGFKKYAVAEPLKDLCSELYGFPRELADTQEGKKTLWKVGYKTKTIRELLIDTAKTDKARFGDAIYIREVLQRIKGETHENIVISDLRYFTEHSEIKQFAILNKYSLSIWKIRRDGQQKSPVDDPSEYALDTLIPNITIQNPGNDLEALKKIVFANINRNHELPNPQNEDDGCSIM